MNKVKYRLAESGEFIIEDFNKAKAFSSFFPGIAGLDGIPLWAFYVNRGQCISSFGTKDKDDAILEFLPANQAYALTSLKGFRTFLKIKEGRRAMFHEPFREAATKAAGRTSTKMTISPCKLEIEEINRYLGIAVNVSYITIPNEPFAALARKVSLTNISKKKIDIEIIDGLPQVISFGITEDDCKLMSRTIEAWVKVSNLEKNAPFYALKVKPNDTPELEYVERGNFYLACEIGSRAGKILKPIVDPDIVFGTDGDISYPRIFAESEVFAPDGYQKTECRTPSGFAYTKLNLASGESKKIISIIGNIKDVKGLSPLISKIKDTAYFEKKLSENEDIIKRLQDTVFTKSSSNEFDYYCRQTFLDNLLRGGFPVTIDTPSGPFVFYAYARKHGDLERDYNSFLLQPSYYSQGNGAYRDINQNRRNDALFNPDVKHDNILTFINAVQPDGFNPHQVEGITVSLKSGSSTDTILRKYIRNLSAAKKTKEFLRSPFTPGGLIFFLETEGIMPKKSAKEFLKDVLAVSVKSDLIRPGEGYWTDHWTYNLDLLENYLMCYPENQKALLFDDRAFTFYDTYLRVNPRDEKYVYADGKIRQFGSVSEDEDKKQLIERRNSQPHRARVKNGKGEVYRTSLFVKLVCILANKIASLDPFGIGIEMEAGKPGWCDSLNNLPGIFGSSVAETFELKRLILFLKSSLAELGISSDCKIPFPCELADFLIELDRLLTKTVNFGYWDASSLAKERYRRRVWFGFDGKERLLSIGELSGILDKALLKVEKGLKAAEDKKTGLPYTYFINEVKKYRFIHDKGKRNLNKDGLPLVKALVVYHNPKRLDTFGDRAVRPMAIELKRKDESDIKVTGSRVPSPFADRIRQGHYDRIDVALS